MVQRTTARRGRSARIADVQLSMVASGPVLEAGSVDPFAPPNANQRQPSGALLVPGLRAAVNAWRLDDYPGLSETTRRLFDFWFEEDHPVRGGEPFRYYFAQREAIETIVYCYEVAGARSFRALLERDEEWIKGSYDRYGRLEAYRRTDMGPTDFLPYDENTDRWPHYVCKLATGGGKTKVMALAIVWSYFHHLYEPGSTLACNFVVIAPNLIVFERLRADFGSGSIFLKDPLIPPEWRSDFDLQVVLQDEASPPSATGTLYLTNIHRLYEDRPAEPPNPVEALLPPRVNRDLRSGSAEELIERVARHDDLLILNDEAHHIHDPKLAWAKVIAGIHERLQARDTPGLAAQLDFSATPKHNDGVLFEQIVTDYPLADAIAAGIVKQPLLGELSDPHQVPSDDASVRYRQWIDAGVARLKDYEALHAPAGKRPLLFVMAADTEEADQIARYLESLEGFGGRVLTIHTNRQGEISESATGKNKELLEELRRASREVDLDTNPYRAIVSVLMLREGWDVRNVTVIVGLRPFKAASQILPEQTIGRGLRLMYPGGSGAGEQVDILGTEAFEDFVKELKKTDNVEFRQRPVTAPLEGRTIAVVPSRVAQYDILIPQLSNMLRRSEEAIGQIDVYAMGKRLALGAETPAERQGYRLTDVLTQKLLRELELELPLPANAQGILWYYAESIRKEARVPKSLFDRIVALVKEYLVHVVFGETVDLDDPRVQWRLMEDDARAAVVGPFVSAIHRVVREEVPVELREPPIPVSQTRAFVSSGRVCEGVKTVFNLVPIGPRGGLEEAFVAFLDDAPDVAAYAKNTKKVGLAIDYQSSKGHFRLYEPDFIVRLNNGEHWLVETKGQEDAEVPLKDARARVWCRDATELTAATEAPQRWQYVKVAQATFESHHGRTFDSLVRHAAAWQG
jgi:type III restriction enzyme